MIDRQVDSFKQMRCSVSANRLAVRGQAPPHDQNSSTQVTQTIKRFEQTATSEPYLPIVIIYSYRITSY